METTSQFGTQNSMRCFLGYNVKGALVDMLKGKRLIIGRAIRNRSLRRS
ncbi:MAG: hypothetical protein QOH70_3826 [Blastocatellia bacterium]|jgi:hypothetical protein|nr:hypothetical protein [Blastocatellia bacterium]